MKKPMVAIDARMVSEIPHGISRYVTLLAKGLRQVHEKSGGLPYEPVFLVDTGSSNYSLPDFQGFRIQKTTLSFLSGKELLEIPSILTQLGAAVYHSPSFSSLWSPPCPYLVTIHDLNHLAYGNLTQKLYYHFLLRQFAQRAGAILTVSEFSRDEIARWLRMSPARIKVVYNAIEPAPVTDELADADDAILSAMGLVRGEYFICLGNQKKHKNINLLLSAYSQYRRRSEQTGAAPWPLVLSISHESAPAGVIARGQLSEVAATVLLRNARALFSPSLYEGFGLPPVEGAAVGVRLAISSIPPHKEALSELLEGEVHWVEPSDLEGWADAFKKAQEGAFVPPSPSSRHKILTRFSVSRIGSDMDRVYRSMLGESL